MKKFVKYCFFVSSMLSLGIASGTVFEDGDVPNLEPQIAVPDTRHTGSPVSQTVTPDGIRLVIKINTNQQSSPF